MSARWFKRCARRALFAIVAALERIEKARRRRGKLAALGGMVGISTTLPGYPSDTGTRRCGWTPAGYLCSRLQSLGRRGGCWKVRCALQRVSVICTFCFRELTQNEYVVRHRSRWGTRGEMLRPHSTRSLIIALAGGKWTRTGKVRARRVQGRRLPSSPHAYSLTSAKGWYQGVEMLKKFRLATHQGHRDLSASQMLIVYVTQYLKDKWHFYCNSYLR